MGGRSRVAAQMLSGKGFREVYNLSGGFKAWKGGSAIGDETLGLEHFTGDEPAEKTLLVAYALEEGLHDFYVSMIPKIKNEHAQTLFRKLASVERHHQDRILEEYNKITGEAVPREEFIKNGVGGVVEGGLSAEEYADMFHPDWESVNEIISIAMSIEAQAFDLYQRAADRSANAGSREMLVRIAEEERAHMALLGELIENV